MGTTFDQLDARRVRLLASLCYFATLAALSIFTNHEYALIPALEMRKPTLGFGKTDFKFSFECVLSFSDSEPPIVPAF